MTVQAAGLTIISPNEVRAFARVDGVSVRLEFEQHDGHWIEGPAFFKGPSDKYDRWTQARKAARHVFEQWQDGEFQ